MIHSTSRRATSIVAFIAAISMVPGFGNRALGVTVTDVTTNTVLFHDGFESGDFNSPSAGTWVTTGGADPSSVTVITSTTPPNPGPFEGTHYARIFRQTSTTNGEGNLDGTFTTQSNPGDVIRLSAMLYVPANSGSSRAVLFLDNGDFNTATGIVFSDGNGNVMAETGAGFTVVDTGLDYIPDTWQRWDITSTIGGSTFDVAVGGNTASGFAAHSSGPISRLEINNGNANAGVFFVDAIVVPEPATALVAGAAMIVGLRRRRKL
jgi:hypothetical protein